MVRRTAEVALSWPLENMGPSLPNLLATVAGNLFELKPFSGLKLFDVTLPPEFLDSYQGPQFGVEGTRRLTGVTGGRLIGTIIKPSVGMTPEQTAAQVECWPRLAWTSSRMMSCRPMDRIAPLICACPLCCACSMSMPHKTGKRPMYAANITGEIDQMLRRHDLVVANRGPA